MKVSPQNYTIKTYTTDNGLPHNNIRDISIDSSGFLWLSTWDGLSRYDGYEFKNYHHIPGDSTSLQYFSVNKVCVDGSNNLWVLSVSADLMLFDRINETFSRIELPPEVSERNIFNINIDKSGDLWMIGKNQLFRREHRDGKIHKYRIINEEDEPDFIPSAINDFSLDADGTMWFLGSKVSKLEKTIDSFDEISYKISATYTINDNIHNKFRGFDRIFRLWLFRNTDDEILLLTNSGLYKLNLSEKAFNPVDKVTEQVVIHSDMFKAWAIPGKGLTVFNPYSGKIIEIKLGSDILVDHIFIQKPDIVWFSTTTKSGVPTGLTRAAITPEYFKTYLEEEPGSTVPAVFPIIKDKFNNIIVGSRGADNIIKISPDGTKGSLGNIPAGLHNKGGHPRSLINTGRGIWIGYFLDLLLFYDYETGSFVRHFAGEQSYRTMAVDKNDRLYIGTNKLTVYDPVKKESRFIWKYDGSSVFYSLMFDRNNILWGGLGESLLLRYNPADGQARTYRISPEVYHIEDLCMGDDGKLWLALLGGGICEFDPETGQKKFFTTASGLSNNTTYSILKDNNGNLWISTDKGISRYNPATGLFRNFDMNDGLKITEFNSDASFISDSGEFFLGGMGGFVGFYPERIESDDNYKSETKIIITGFKISGNFKKLEKPVNNIDTIILSKGENNFQISFSTTDFLNADKALFRYTLAGIDEGWITTDHRNRNINYSNLHPGSYDLVIEATNRSGEWSASRKVVFIAEPYFYQTTIFFVLTGLVMFGIFILIISLYLRQFRQKERQVQDHLRLQALRGQMNPHFIFNSLNSINYFISNNDSLSANRYIADFSRLIRRILSNMGSDFVNFPEEINSIKDYLEIEHLRFGDRFDYKIDFSGIEEPESLMVFPGLIQPFIENAIWHGVRALENRKGNIKLTISKERKDCLKCVVEDDGIGRKLAGKMRSHFENHNSRGISIVLERLQIISKIRGTGYSAEVNDLYPEKEESGTKVMIEIPLK